MTSLTQTPIGTAAEVPPSPRPIRDAVLELVGLTSGYGDLAAVRNVSLRVSPGEVVALFGPNGAGKTTTLLAAVGVLPRMQGSVKWRGEVTRKPLHKLVRGGLAFVPEERSIIAGLSTKDNLRLGRGSVDAALAHFPELEELLGRKAGLLSGGQQQMLTLARALASDPAALLVDELSLGLAPLVVERLLQAVRKAADEKDLAVLLVEQQARRALSVADRWYLLGNGELVTEGNADTGIETLESAYLSKMPAKNVEPAPPVD